MSDQMFLVGMSDIHVSVIEIREGDIEVLYEACTSQAQRHRLIEEIDHPEDINLRLSIFLAIVLHCLVPVISQVLGPSQ
jgi:hypothetical protein